jgi:hypothetical protein
VPTCAGVAPILVTAALVATAAGSIMSATVSHGRRSDLGGKEVLPRTGGSTLFNVEEND